MNFEEGRKLRREYSEKVIAILHMRSGGRLDQRQQWR